MTTEYACAKCNTVDNREITKEPHGKDLCSYCRTGKWHGFFEQAPYDPLKDMVDNRPSNIGLD